MNIFTLIQDFFSKKKKALPIRNRLSTSDCLLMIANYYDKDISISRPFDKDVYEFVKHGKVVLEVSNFEIRNSKNLSHLGEELKKALNNL